MNTHFGVEPWCEVAVDLFTSPLSGFRTAVCTTVECLPFAARTFGAIICVGEVLAYCDPSRAIQEFARVAVPGGTLICDFPSSRGIRFWFKNPFGRAADMITDQYNGSPEQIWVYDPNYISSLLESAGFGIHARFGTHTCSALARKCGASLVISLRLERLFSEIKFLSYWAELVTFVAYRL
ncbi:MAG: methyltransferase domain-containing protein [Verrucomicrobiota bacterium]